MNREKTAAVLGGIFAATLAVPVLALPSVRVAQAAAKAQAPQVSAAPAAEFPVAARALIDQYCTSCHNDRVRAASLVLTSDKIDIANVGANPDIWEKVVKKVGSGAMPRAGSQRPAPAVLKNFVGGLSTALDRVAAANPNPGRPVPHRLNRTEYTNAIRDLLALDRWQGPELRTQNGRRLPGGSLRRTGRESLSGVEAARMAPTTAAEIAHL